LPPHPARTHDGPSYAVVRDSVPSVAKVSVERVSTIALMCDIPIRCSKEGVAAAMKRRWVPPGWRELCTPRGRGTSLLHHPQPSRRVRRCDVPNRL